MSWFKWTEKIKFYDFTRPDRFSMDQIITIKKLHERFIHNFQFES
jgi:flagellar motor switch protein FliM